MEARNVIELAAVLMGEDDRRTSTSGAAALKIKTSKNLMAANNRPVCEAR